MKFEHLSLFSLVDGPCLPVNVWVSGTLRAALLLGLAAGLISAQPPLSGGRNGPPAWRDSNGQLLPSAIGQHSHPGEVLLGPLPDALRLRQQADSRMPAVGVARSVGLATVRGKWTCEVLSTPPQTLWRIALSSDGATAVRLKLKGFDVGPNSLWVYPDTSSGLSVGGPFTGSGPLGDGEFMTGLIEGSVALEVACAVE
jgi:hypothetical protein